jgi:hypothetical protein
MEHLEQVNETVNFMTVGSSHGKFTDLSLFNCEVPCAADDSL